MDAAQLADTALILQRNTDLVNLRAAGLITEEAFQAGQRQLAELASCRACRRAVLRYRC